MLDRPIVAWNERQIKEVTIHLGHLPDSGLNPNKRLHWMQLAKLKKEAKEEAYLRCRGEWWPRVPFETAHITITWVSKSKRRRDIDNLFASMKAYIDGIVFADVIEDDSSDCVSYSLYYLRGDEDDTIIHIRQL